jgi:DNA-directed RNA polymerase specialized sigma24 family protein
MLTGEIEMDPHKWVDLHADYLYAYAITRIGDEEQVRDLVQETFLAALER